MTRDDLDQKYTSAGSTHEEYRKWITRLTDEADEAELQRAILSTMGQMESVMMGIYAELVYARHNTPVVATIPAKLQRPKKDGNRAAGASVVGRKGRSANNVRTSR